MSRMDTGETKKSRLRNLSLWLFILILVVTVILMVAIRFRFLRLHILVEEFYIHHWLSVTGTSFIAFFTPAYSYLKCRYPKNIKTLLNIHVFGSLISVMFVSIHFMTETSRPPQSFPPLGTGVALYAAMILLVSTGFLMRYRFAETLKGSWRFLHTGVAVSFYIVIVVHVLHGLGVI